MPALPPESGHRELGSICPLCAISRHPAQRMAAPQRGEMNERCLQIMFDKKNCTKCCGKATAARQSSLRGSKQRFVSSPHKQKCPKARPVYVETSPRRGRRDAHTFIDDDSGRRVACGSRLDQAVLRERRINGSAFTQWGAPLLLET